MSRKWVIAGLASAAEGGHAAKSAAIPLHLNGFAEHYRKACAQPNAGSVPMANVMFTGQSIGAIVQKYAAAAAHRSAAEPESKVSARA